VAVLLRFLFRAVGQYWVQSACILVGLVVEMSYNASISLSFKFLIDAALIPRNQQVLWLILGLLTGGVVLVFCVALGRDYLYAQVCAALLNDLRQRMFSHVQRLSLDFYGRTSLGDITARFATDLAAVDHALTGAVSGVLLPVLDVLSSLALLFVLEWRLALVALLVVPLSLLGPEVLEKRAARASYARKQQEAQTVVTVQEAFSAPALMKAFSLERYIQQRFTQQLQELARSSVRVGFLSALMERSSTMGFLLTYVLVTGLGAYMTFTETLSIGAFMSFQALFLTMSWALALGMQYVPHLVQATGGMQRIADLLTEVPQVSDLPEATPFPPLRQTIAFENVTFTYHNTTPRNLNDVSFTLQAGESVAIVGPSGSGKSTVLNLLMRFYDPTAGRITVDGHDVRDAAQDSWRSQIGLVAQESFLFNTTLRENIRLGRTDATPTEVEAAAGLAELHALIASLPDGYDTVVGERGGRLSGGQRQRVALARALLRHPALLLLDEATSALDPETEVTINTTLARVSRGRTVVTVTHRLASVMQADRILVFDAGQLVEQGRHADLLAQGGVYARLWDKQSGFLISADGTSAVVQATRLRAIPLFAHLADTVLDELAGRFVTERFPAERTIFQEGDPGDKFYLMVRGVVRIMTTGSSGNMVELALLQDGDYFGEIALLQDVPRTATVHTLTPSLCLSLRREHFQRLIETSPELRHVLQEAMITRLAEQSRVKGHVVPTPAELPPIS
jgi:ATP-binding cassette subfamily B protein